MDYSELITKIFHSFAGFLSERKEILTEDNVRYYLFYSLVKGDEDSNNFDLNHFILEKPYINKDAALWSNEILTKSNSNKELDLYYDDKKEDKFAFEIKYHRKTKSTYAHTDEAGKIFNDLKRLSLIKNKGIKKFFVYVTDDEMNKYLSWKKNKNNTYRDALSKFYKAQIGDEITKISFSADNTDIPKTFWSSANDSFNDDYINKMDLKIRKVFETDFTTLSALKLFVKIYEVL